MQLNYPHTHNTHIFFLDFPIPYFVLLSHFTPFATYGGTIFISTVIKAS